MTEMTWQVTTIDLIRHGKPEGGEIFRGSVDVPLTPEGREQMLGGIGRLHTHSAEDNWDAIVTSPLLRCADFAHEMAERDGIAIAVDAGFREISFGDWDGQSFKAIKAQYGDQFNDYWRNPIENTPPNAEALDAFAERIRGAFWQLVQQYKGQKLLLVTHGGVIRAVLNLVLASAMDSFMRYEVPYASVSRVKIYHDEGQEFPQLDFHNR